MSESLNSLLALLKEHTPVSRPSHHSKPWWTPHLTILRREYHKAARAARKHDTPHMREVGGTSKAGYFKAIKAAKNKHWSSFVTGLFLSNENTVGPAIDLLALVLREASRDRR